jgi:uncharacterized protein involved in exopolysaccharide biosynthesis
MHQRSAVMTERSRIKFEVVLAISEKRGRLLSVPPREQNPKNQKMKTKASAQAEIRQLTRILAGYVSRLTSERSTLSEEESALLSARANETMLRLLVLDSELNG